jgi:hypothetical protein
MLFKQLAGGSVQAEDFLNAKHLPAADTAAVVTISSVDEYRHTIHKIVWSYSTDPTGGRLTISDGGTTEFDIDITKGGPGSLNFTFCGAKESTLVVTLAAGGGGITGKLYVEYTTERA